MSSSVSAVSEIPEESPVISPMWENAEEEEEDEKTGRPTISEEERKAKLDDFFKEEVLEDRSTTWTKAREGGIIVPSEAEKSASEDEHTSSEEVERVAIPPEQPPSKSSAAPLEEPESAGVQEKSPGEKILIPLESILEESPKEQLSTGRRIAAVKYDLQIVGDMAPISWRKEIDKAGNYSGQTIYRGWGQCLDRLQGPPIQSRFVQEMFTHGKSTLARIPP